MFTLFQTHPRIPRFSIAELMAVVAALAVALAWPVVLLPTCGVVLTFALRRAGLTLLAICVIMSVLGSALGLASGFLLPR
jgi:predicted membrane-bound spermidine synthase